MARLTLAAALILATAQPARAWWAGGHMLTAQVALDSGIMSFDTIKAVNAVIEEIKAYYPASPEFVSSAAWADDLKAEGAYQEAEFQ